MNSLKDRVELALDEIRPFLKNDGGDIKLLKIVKEKEVQVALLGACHDCRVNRMTLKNGVEVSIKKHAPEIDLVTQVNAPL